MAERHDGSEAVNFSLDFEEVCPKCGTQVKEWSRVCFGLDPHVEYRCFNCLWRGRDPKVQQKTAGES